MTQDDGHERRRVPRVRVEGEVVGNIHSTSLAPVLDISEKGAMLEVNSVLRPGSVCAVRLVLGPDQRLSLKGKVVRSYVHGFHAQQGGETVVKYRAAVQFLGMTEDQKIVLRSHIGQLASVDLDLDVDLESGSES